MAARKKKGGGEGGGGGGGEAGGGRWMLTYLDMVTLLFGLFVILYAMSNVPVHKTDIVIDSIRAGFAGGMNIFKGNESGGTTTFKELFQEGIKEQTEYVNDHSEDLMKSQLKKVHIAFVEEERGVVISLFNDVYFDSGSAKLNPESKEMLKTLTPILMTVERDIRVEGHTDEIPVTGKKNDQGYDNFNLAADRALNVLHFLEDEGVDTRRMAAISYGANRPNDGSMTPTGKAFNRVVDIVILKRKIPKNKFSL